MEVTVDDEVTTSLAPSHIVADGRFIHLPPPTARERRQFFERSIAQHGLLQEDLSGKTKAEEDEEGEEVKDEPADATKKVKQKEIKVHPLAVASAKIQANGLNELNRAINLSTLVATGEYFGMSNIVDPSLVDATAAGSGTTDTKEPSTIATTSASVSSPTAKRSRKDGDEEEQRIKSLYVLKRKRSQFLQASRSLQLHGKRLQAGIVAQAQPDQRLRQLRHHWRLVAPEHGTRALPHATRSNETVAVDVDVYYNANGPSRHTFGRLTSRVPRYATLELKETYPVDSDLTKWQQKFQSSVNDKDDMDIDDPVVEEKGELSNETNNPIWTIAEPFAIADPTLGKIDVNFDPTKVTTMLSLQFDIEKASTGFRQSAVLRSIISSETLTSTTIHTDEQVLFALQHSLFCAQLFESIRCEIAPDATQEMGAVQLSPTRSSQTPVVWISQESSVNFLPPPLYMSGGGGSGGGRSDGSCGLVPLCVIHCHEGEVKVQLDCEYTLRVKLVEADDQDPTSTRQQTPEINNGHNNSSLAANDPCESGSQSPKQLLVLCRTLLYHAEERYHEHSKRLAQETAVMAAEATARDASDKNKATPTTNKMTRDVHARKQERTTPRILQSCVSLGSKLIMEQRVRTTLAKLQNWLKKRCNADAAPLNENSDKRVDNVLHVTWLSLSVLDLHSQFTMSFRHWVADATLVGEEITITSTTTITNTDNDGDGSNQYRKVRFHSDAQLELYLKMMLQRLLRTSSTK